MDRGAWRARVHGIAKSWTWLSGTDIFFHAASLVVAGELLVMAYEI